MIGRVTVIAELKKPHVLIEEPILPEEIAVPYSIHGQEIVYQYPYFLETTFVQLQKCLKDKEYDMTSYIEKVNRCMEKYREKKEQIRREEEEKRTQEARKKEEAERAREARRREEAKRAEETRKRAEEAKRKAEERKAQEKKYAFCEEERRLFQLNMPYTQAELKKKRRLLLKQCHPDAGGSEEMAKRINTAYDVLWKYAAA